MNTWSKLADKATVERTVKALGKNGIIAFFVQTKEEAKAKVASLLPKGAEIMDMSSMTLEASGIAKEIQESGKFVAVKPKLYAMDKTTQEKKIREMGAAPDFAVGSVQAVTEEGHLMIASNTGSQLPAYAYAAGKVIWVVGTQKIVKNLDEGFKRIYEYVLPLESERVKKAYGMPGSFVSKLLIVNREIQPERLSLIFVNEVLGF